MKTITSDHQRHIKEAYKTLHGSEMTMLTENEHRADLLIQEGKLQDVMTWLKEKGKAAQSATKDFLIKFKQELQETKEGAQILAKLVKGEALSTEETSTLSTQIKDLAKGLPLLTLLALPGGGLATVALVKVAKKFGIDLMPTAFQEGKKIKITKQQLRRIIKELLLYKV